MLTYPEIIERVEQGKVYALANVNGGTSWFVGIPDKRAVRSLYSRNDTLRARVAIGPIKHLHDEAQRLS